MREVERWKELDFTKGVLILLVVIFHLGYFHEKHPMLYQIVYSFHMPCFLLISGYLFNVDKSIKDFVNVLRKVFVPYFLFETIYLLCISIMGTHWNTSNEVQQDWRFFI